jgi:hypothetical protein
MALMTHVGRTSWCDEDRRQPARAPRWSNIDHMLRTKPTHDRSPPHRTRQLPVMRARLSPDPEGGIMPSLNRTPQSEIDARREMAYFIELRRNALRYGRTFQPGATATMKMIRALSIGEGMGSSTRFGNGQRVGRRLLDLDRNGLRLRGPRSLAGSWGPRLRRMLHLLSDAVRKGADASKRHRSDGLDLRLHGGRIRGTSAASCAAWMPITLPTVSIAPSPRSTATSTEGPCGRWMRRSSSPAAPDLGGLLFAEDRQHQR